MATGYTVIQKMRNQLENRENQETWVLRRFFNGDRRLEVTVQKQCQVWLVVARHNMGTHTMRNDCLLLHAGFLGGFLAQHRISPRIVRRHV